MGPGRCAREKLTSQRAREAHSMRCPCHTLETARWSHCCPAQVPKTTHRFCANTHPSFSHTALGAMGVMVYPANHHLHMIPIPGKPVSRPRTCLTVAPGDRAHCRLPTDQQGQQRSSARKGQGRRKFRMESPLVSGPEELRYGKRSFTASQTEPETSHVSE